jgi:hypothetical protein
MRDRRVAVSKLVRQKVIRGFNVYFYMYHNQGGTINVVSRLKFLKLTDGL